MTPSSVATSGSRLLPVHKGRAAVVIASFVVALYVVEGLDQLVFGGMLDLGGIVPRRVEGLDGVLFSPLLHAGWAHLVANTLPLLVFGFLVLAEGFVRFVAVTAVVWLLGGAGTWLTGSGLTVGASGLIFGWLAFLLVRGFFARSGRQILLAVVLFVVYGGVLLGVLPGTPGVSWQAHLFGALAGIVAARTIASAERTRSPRPARGPVVGPPTGS